jgi:pimeloyl-ACP methyl ester carboxylesterase
MQNPLRGVLLIAPHWGKRVSLIVRALLHIPFPGEALLRITGPAKIQNLLRESVDPQPIPAPYAALGPIYAQTHILRRSLLEPCFAETEVHEFLRCIQAPVHVLVGQNDKALPMAQVVRTFAKSFTIIPKAGHALPWTHGELCVQHLKHFLENS